VSDNRIEMKNFITTSGRLAKQKPKNDQFTLTPRCIVVQKTMYLNPILF